MACPFIFLMMSFEAQSSNFDEVQFIRRFFLLGLMLLVLYLRALCLTEGHRVCLLCFLLDILSFSSYTDIYDPFWVNLIYGAGTTVCWKKLSFPHWVVLVLSLKISWPYIPGFIYGLSSIPLIHRVMFMQISHHLDTVAL